MVALSNETLQDVTARIVKELRPERVYLFGSRAYGTPRAESDLDIMLVFREGGARRIDLACAARRLLRDLPCGLDVLVRFRDEFESRAAWPTTIEAIVKEKGRLLYG